MKKTLAVVLAAMMAASLTACGGSAAKDTTAAAAKAPAAESTAEKTGEGAGTDETEKAAGTEEKKQYKFKFIYLILRNPCVFKENRHFNVRSLCIFPCFCPYEPKQGKLFV